MSTNLPAKRTTAVVKPNAKEQKLFIETVTKARASAKELIFKNKALHTASAVVEKHIESGIERNFRSRWDIGKVLKDIRDDEKTYGENAIGLLAIHFNQSRSTLDKSIHFYSDYSAKSLDRLVKGRMKASGGHITWPHIEKLYIVSDAAVRDKLIEQTLENDWSPDNLDYYARKETNQLGKAKHAGGRDLKVPGTPMGRFENFAKVTRVIMRNDVEMWRHPQFGFIATVNEFDVEKLTPELFTKMDEDILIADQALTTLTAVKLELEQARDVAKTRVAAAEEPEEEEEEAPTVSTEEAPATAVA